jgi:hypothetical protein
MSGLGDWRTTARLTVETIDDGGRAEVVELRLDDPAERPSDDEGPRASFRPWKHASFTTADLAQHRRKLAIIEEAGREAGKVFWESVYKLQGE